MLNTLVKAYLQVFDRQLSDIKNYSPDLQRDQLKKIGHSPYFKHFFSGRNPGSFENHDSFIQEFDISGYGTYAQKVEGLFDPESPLKVPYFAQSSGTSGERKLLPVSELFVRQNLLRGTWYVLNTLYTHKSRMSVFRFKNLLIGGAIYDYSKSRTVADISGIMLSRIPWYMRSHYVPSVDVATSPNWREKIELTAQAASRTRNISLLGGTPTWVLSAIKRVLQLTNTEKISDVWPHLECYIHGGVHFKPYMEQFEQLIDIDSFLYLEVYNATEGFFAFQDDPNEDGLLLMTDNGIYYEFIPLKDYYEGSSKSVQLEQVELGVNYVLVISSIMGLIRYEVGDVVQFTSRQPYRITVCGRTTEYINAFGEDLLLNQVLSALEAVNQKHKCSIFNFTVAPKYISVDEKGRHDWYVEFDKQPPCINDFSRDLDLAIQKENINYRQKRSEDLAITSLKLTPLDTGFYEDFLDCNDRLGGQSKIQKLRNDRKLADPIETHLKKFEL